MEKRKAASLIKYSISDRNFLNKTLHSTTKYANVKAKINSGFNEMRRHEIEAEIRKYYKIRSDEVFRRISLIDLLNLLLVYAEECAVYSATNVEIEQQQALNTEGNYEGAVSSLEEPLCPFLILDVRLEDEFRIGHLTTAVCYPHFKLSKAFNWESVEMLRYKNHPDWIIIICDEKENLSPVVATTLVQRGYDNAFVLSGGLKLAYDKIGPPLITASESRVISSETAEFLSEIVSASLKPSDHPLQWWLTKKTMDGRNELPLIHNDMLRLSVTPNSLNEDRLCSNSDQQSIDHEG